jgi:hypothetical protein
VENTENKEVIEGIDIIQDLIYKWDWWINNKYA